METLNWSSPRRYMREDIQRFSTEKAGIYLIYAERANAYKQLVYVGQADNIKTRLLEHISENEKNEILKRILSHEVCYYSYAEVPLPNKRNSIENFIYNKCHPEANINRPPTQDGSTEVNITCGIPKLTP